MKFFVMTALVLAFSLSGLQAQSRTTFSSSGVGAYCDGELATPANLGDYVDGAYNALAQLQAEIARSNFAVDLDSQQYVAMDDEIGFLRSEIAFLSFYAGTLDGSGSSAGTLTGVELCSAGDILDRCKDSSGNPVSPKPSKSNPTQCQNCDLSQGIGCKGCCSAAKGDPTGVACGCP